MPLESALADLACFLGEISPWASFEDGRTRAVPASGKLAAFLTSWIWASTI